MSTVHRLSNTSWVWLGVAIAVALFFSPVGSVKAAEISTYGLATARADLRNKAQSSYRVLCFHDIRDDVRNTFDKFPEGTAIDTQDFIKQMAWLKENGYHPISLNDIFNAKSGRQSLPEKAVLLTFDDGFKSVYTKVFPILKLLNFPAVIAIVGEWIETPKGQDVAFGDAMIPRSQFADWEEIQEMVASGLVEVASHSHGLHKGIIANPQGNTLPSAVVHAFLPEENTYESNAVYAVRIQADLAKSAAKIEQHLGRKPRAMIWPYGIYNRVALDSAAAAGMPVTMNLDNGPNYLDGSLQQIRRSLLRYDDGVPGMVRLLASPPRSDRGKIPAQHVIGISLDSVVDPDPVAQEANLSKLLDRITLLRPSAVILNAYSDVQHSGVAEAMYFPNRHLPMKADLFSRAAWQLRTRVGVEVYAAMPVLSFDLQVPEAASGHLVAAAPESVKRGVVVQEYRLSVFDPVVRKAITEIYEDLGKSGIFSGIVFGDDGHLAIDEDASPAAIAVYQNQWHLSGTVGSLQRDPAQLVRWSTLKTQYLDEFVSTLAKKIQSFQPDALVARSLKDDVLFDTRSKMHYAQNYHTFLEQYDFAVVNVDAASYAIKQNAIKLNSFIKNNAAGSLASQKSLFEVNVGSTNAHRAEAIMNLATQLQLLHSKGARHFGYFPDGGVTNAPPERDIRPVISIQTEISRRLK